MSSLSGWQELSCFAVVCAGRFLCNQIPETNTIVYVHIQHDFGCTLQSERKKVTFHSSWLLFPPPLLTPAKQVILLLNGLGLFLRLKAQFPISTNYIAINTYAKIDLGVLPEMDLSNLE